MNMNHPFKRFLSFLLAMAMIFGMLPSMAVKAEASTTSSGSLTDSNIGWSVKQNSWMGNSTWTAVGTSITCTTDSQKFISVSPCESQLTITNNSGQRAQLSFTYSLGGKGGTVSGAISASSGNYTKTLEAGSTITINMKSSTTSKDDVAYLYITNLNLRVIEMIDVTFATADGGSYTLDGTNVVADAPKNVELGTSFSVVATPNSGYKFVAWYNKTNDSYISTSSTETIEPSGNCTIYPVFVATNTATWKVGVKYFTDLADAIDYASSDGVSNPIVLVSDGVITENYTIPSGETLLIPFNDAATSYGAAPAAVTDTFPTPYAFRTLTMASGASITVNGVLEVGGQHAAGGGSKNYSGSPCGPLGFIQMNSGSQIIVAKGGTMYAWGYVVGDGNVNVSSGGKIYENFQLADFQGGTITTELVNVENQSMIFPFSQYYVQNVEVAMTMNAGSELYVYVTVYMAYTRMSMPVKFIGNSSAMFVIESGNVVKDYDPVSERLNLDVNGNMNLSNLYLEFPKEYHAILQSPLIGMDTAIDSSNYILPINGNISININSGTTRVSGQYVSLRPGVEVNLAQGANFVVDADSVLYIYDSAQYVGKGFVHPAVDIRPVAWTPYRGTASSRGTHSLTDVKIDVNGTVTVDGYIFTTADEDEDGFGIQGTGGANITSSQGTGRIVYNTTPDAESYGFIFEYVYGAADPYATVAALSAELRNADGSYTYTDDAVEGDTYTWNDACQKWVKVEDGVDSDAHVGEGHNCDNCGKPRTACEDSDLNHTCDIEGCGASVGEHADSTGDGDHLCDYGCGATIGDHTYTSSVTAPTCEAKGYTTHTCSECGYSYTDNEVAATGHNYTVTYEWATDGTSCTANGTCANGCGIPYTERVNATDNVTAIGTCVAEEVITYTATFASEWATTQTKEVKGAKNPVNHTGATTYKDNGDGKHTQYWTCCTAEVLTEDHTHSQGNCVCGNIKQYTITWIVEGEKTTETYTYGQTPAYPNSTPTKAGDAQYSYAFSGWNTEVAAVTGDATYTAVFTQSVNEYTISWDTDGDGDVDDTTTVAYGTVPTHADGVKDATAEYTYTFNGWTPSVCAVTGDATYTATFTQTPVNYTVTWNVDGVKTQETVAFDAAISKPADPVKEGYTFAGWTPDVASTMPAQNVEYTATWTVNAYTVTWTVNGGTYTTTTVSYGETIEVPAYTTPEGHTFSGWTGIAATMPAENLTYDASLTVNNYTVTWTVNGETYTTTTVAYGAAITAPAYETPEGHTFSGWTADATMPAKDVTYNATLTVNQYTVTFIVDGVETVQTYDFGADVPAIADPEKEGYEFKGWGADVPATMPAQNLTFTAQWQILTYQLTWVIDGEEQQPIDVIYGYTLNAPAAPTKDGYTFTGWTGEIPATMPAKDITITLTSTWSANAASYTVETYEMDVNGVYQLISSEEKESVTDAAVSVTPMAGEGFTLDTGKSVLSGTVAFDNTTVLKVYYSRNQYTFTTNTDGVEETETYYYGAAVTAPAAPEKTGYTFTGWDAEIPATMPAEDVNITAQFSINQYTITFNTDGGSDVEAITQDYGTAITAPADPTKEGYTFDGWDAEIPATMPAEDLVLTATWEIETYTVTWLNADGTEFATTEATYGEAVTAPTGAPVREGYTFTGWADVPAVMPDNDSLVIQSTWTINQYTITFDVDGVKTTKTYDFGADIVLPTNPAKTGYTFTGWDAEIPATMPAKNVTIKATWSVNQYRIVFMDDDQAVNQITVDFDTDLENYELPTLEDKDGLKFAGWYGVPSHMPAENITVSAIWADNQYIVSFNGNGGTGLMDNMLVDIKAEGDTTVTLPVCGYTMTGYSFGGWDADGDGAADYADGETVTLTGNLDLKAVWKINTYNISWDLAGGAASATMPESVNYGESVVISAPAITRTGYTLVGMQFADGTMLEAQPVGGVMSYCFTMGAENVEITALWQVNTYNVTFTVEGVEYQVVPVNYGETITVPTDPEKEGHTFTGWTVPETMPAENITVDAAWTVNSYTITWITDGKETTETYKYGTSVKVPAAPSKEGYTFSGWAGDEIPSTMGAANITVELESEWTPNAYTVTWNDGTNEITNIQTYDAALVLPTEPTKTGYTFAGWFTAEVGGEKLTAETVYQTAGDTTYYAQWTINQYTISFDNVMESIDSITRDYNTQVTLPNINCDGYIFGGWTLTLGDEAAYEGGATITLTEDLKLYAVWYAETYTITFDSNGGSAVESIEQLYELDVDAPADPTKEGYTFLGWYDGDEKITFPVKMPLNGMALTAKWQINSYTVTWIIDGVTTTETYEYGASIVKPADPSKTGYTFTGWDAEIPTTMGAEDVTVELESNWTVNSYTVTWIIDGVTTTETYAYGAAINAPVEPTKVGHTFIEWTGSIPATMGAENITVELKSNWTVNSYTVKWIIDGVESTETYEYGASINVPAEPTKVGHTFAGWNAEIPAVMGAEDITVTLNSQWDVNEYTVTWIIDGEETTETYTYGASINAPAEPTKVGHTFAGWTGDEIPTTMGAEDVTVELESNWTVNSYTVTWIIDGVTTTETYAYGAAINAPEEPTKVGHTFTEWTGSIPTTMGAEDITVALKSNWTVNNYTVTWNINGEQYAQTSVNYGGTIVAPAYEILEGHSFTGWTVPETMPAENLTVDAQLTVNSYKVTFTVAGEEYQVVTVTYGDVITAPTAPTKEGYTFGGWTLPETMPAKDLTIDAGWTVNSYKVTFTVNGEYYDEITVNYGEKVTAPAYEIPEGHSFTGWTVPESMGAADINLDAKLTVNEYTVTFTVNGEYYDEITVNYGEKVTAPAYEIPEGHSFTSWTTPETMPAKDITLDAKLSVNSYTVTWIIDGEQTTETYTYGAAIKAPAEPTKVGHTFAGWDEKIPETMPAKDITVMLNSQWDVNEYTVKWIIDGVESTETYKFGAAIHAPADPVKVGHTFAGWTGEIPETMGAENVTVELKSNWTVNSYTVTWIVDGETTTETYAYGANINKPAEPTREGYTFTGWTGEIPVTMGAKDITVELTSNWSVNAYTVTWIIDGLRTTEAYEFGAAIKAPAEPTKVGHTFAGWDEKIPETMPAKDITVMLNSQWDVNEYTVKWIIDGVESTETYKFGAAIHAPADPVKVGHTFAGWTGEIPETMGAENVTVELKSNWTVNSYTVTWIIDGETTTATYKYGDEIVKPVDPTKAGYTFTGWTGEIPATMGAEDITVTLMSNWSVNNYTLIWIIDGEEITEVYAYGAEIVMPTEPTKVGHTFTGWTGNQIPETMGASNITITLTSNWTVNEYTVTWIIDGVTTTETYAYGAAIKAPAEPTKEGHTFAGWDSEMPETMGAGNITVDLKSNWTVNEYTITFTTESGTESITANYGQQIDAPAEPTKEGHTFIGWMDEQGREVEFPITMPVDGMELNAAFEINTYTVTYVAEGKVVSTQTVEHGSNASNPDVPSKTGFAGAWDADGKNITADTTITAVYTANAYTLTWIIDGEKSFVTYFYGDEIEAPAEPEKEGYTFQGFTGDKIPETMPASDLTVELTSNWKVNSYTVTMTIDGVTTEKVMNYGDKIDAPVQPTKEGYTFAGWDGALPDTVPAGDLVIVLNSKWTVNSYSITFTTDDGTETITANYGQQIDAPAEPTKEGHTFIGWMDEQGREVEFPITMPVDGLELKASFEINTYTITWKDADGTILEQQTVEYGQMPNYTGETPTKAATKEYTYTFSGWTPAVVAVNGDASYTAVYTAENVLYSVTWLNADGTVLETDHVTYGTMASYDGAQPTKAPTDKGVFNFLGWNDEPGVVTEDVVFTAVFEEVLKNGFYHENGGIYHYIDGELSKAGLIYVDGYLYYVRTTTGEVVVNREYWVTYTNDYVEQGMYLFDEEGRMIGAPEIILKNGFVHENGGIYHYIDDSLSYAGLIYVDGYFYYIKTTTGEVVTNRTYWITETHDMMAPGNYTFDEQGRMINPPVDEPPVPDVPVDPEDPDEPDVPVDPEDPDEPDVPVDPEDPDEPVDPEEPVEPLKNGFYHENGGIYHYVDGQLSYAGLIWVDGYFYYVRTSTGAVVTDCMYWITYPNGYMDQGNYWFDEEGRMVDPPVVILKNGFYNENGGIYHYVDGELSKAGLIYVDGYFYYVRTSSGEVVTNGSYWCTYTNDLVEPGIYWFDEKGHMIDAPEVELKNGFYNENGIIYHYIDGELSCAGLIEVDGNYYYVKTTTGEVVTGRSYWITYTNDLVAPGNYTFAADGKMILD